MLDKILYPISWVISWVMYYFHQALTFLGFGDGPGVAWVISIVLLTAFIRVLLIPLFFKQIKASRGMQILQPEMQAIQKKYKGKTDAASREAMSRETMALYKKHNTNPFSSCLPILLQSPIFFALFRMLNALPTISNGTSAQLGPINEHIAQDIEHSTVFGASLSDIFLKTDSAQSKVVVGILILTMCATQFFTQRQLTMKNMPKAALEGPMANTQKMLLYAYPFIFAVSGVNFPVGVLVYWVTTNLWSMGQQFYTIRRMPAPGSEAERLMKERKARHNKGKGVVAIEDAPVIEAPRSGQRQQPKRKSRQKGSSGRPQGLSDVPLGMSEPIDAEPEDAPVGDVPVIEAPRSGQRQQPKRKARQKGAAGRVASAEVDDEEPPASEDAEPDDAPSEDAEPDESPSWGTSSAKSAPAKGGSLAKGTPSARPPAKGGSPSKGNQPAKGGSPSKGTPPAKSPAAAKNGAAQRSTTRPKKPKQ